MSVNIRTDDNYLWVNEHNNVSKQVLHRHTIENDATTEWKDGLAGIQQMISQSHQRSERLRTYGGRWSLSDVAVCNDGVHNSKPLTWFAPISPNSIIGTPLYPNDPKPLNERLYFFQCGCQINQINNKLEEGGLCLATTGASNGQTIAGAVSTGTHGSALKIGAIHDSVRAIHLVTSEKEHVILQPNTNPIVKKSLSDVFGADLVSNDDLFYSALVSFGSFGVIHGLIIETQSLFMLKDYCLKTDYDKLEPLYPLLSKFNHSSSNNFPRFFSQFNITESEDPHHVRIILNPHSSSNNAFLEVMYRLPYNSVQLSPMPTGTTTRVSNDVLSEIGALTFSFDVLVPVLVNLFFDKVATPQDGFVQTPKNIFGDSIIQKPANGGASAELGVPIGNALHAVRIIKQKASDLEFMGIIGIRFVKKSLATLAFTQFSPLTCTIELPGLNSPDTNEFYKQVFSELDKAAIPFTLHWGQQGDYSLNRLNTMYGPSLTTWINARKQLLPNPMQRYMFSNDFLKRCGLSESPVLAGGNTVG